MCVSCFMCEQDVKPSKPVQTTFRGFQALLSGALGSVIRTAEYCCLLSTRSISFYLRVLRFCCSLCRLNLCALHAHLVSQVSDQDPSGASASAYACTTSASYNYILYVRFKAHGLFAIHGNQYLTLLEPPHLLICMYFVCIIKYMCSLKRPGSFTMSTLLAVWALLSTVHGEKY